MPYIKKEDRLRINTQLSTPYIGSPGELNYLLTFYCNNYMKRNGGVSYKNINDIMGALEGAKQEFYRRVAAPYEDKKKKENGDVY